MNHRLSRVRDYLREHNLEGVIVSKPENRRYLSGFTGSAGMLLIGAEEARLITDFRYTEQASQQAPNYTIVKHAPDIYDTLAAEIKSLGWSKVGFESDFVNYDSYKRIVEITVEPVPVQLDGLRMIKDESELASIRKAVEVADSAFKDILPLLKPGARERDIALEIEFAMRRRGAEKHGFDTIVASGVRSALPHGRASDKLIEAGDFVTIDFGAVCGGYTSDATRTVVIGKASAKQKEIYQIVLDAQLAGVAAVAAGKLGKDVDAVARKIISDAGYGENFGHGLGHGLGLFIHENPRLSPIGDITLAPNMVVTVEPGIYLPGWGGVRIEDTVVVTPNGATILTAVSKELMELDW